MEEQRRSGNANRTRSNGDHPRPSDRSGAASRSGRFLRPLVHERGARRSPHRDGVGGECHVPDRGGHSDSADVPVPSGSSGRPGHRRGFRHRFGAVHARTRTIAQTGRRGHARPVVRDARATHGGVRPDRDRSPQGGAGRRGRRGVPGTRGPIAISRRNRGASSRRCAGDATSPGRGAVRQRNHPVDGDGEGDRTPRLSAASARQPPKRGGPRPGLRQVCRWPCTTTLPRLGRSRSDNSPSMAHSPTINGSSSSAA